MQKEKKNYHYQLKKKYTKKQILIILILFACIISLVSILGRYITHNVGDFFVRSKEFYFYSDKLAENMLYYQIDNWSGVDNYVITVNMNSNKNNIEASTYDIGYQISYKCTDNAICSLSKNSGTIYATTNSDFFNLTITPNTQLKTGDKVILDIEVVSTTKYSKKLKGRFTLVVGKENLSFQITDAREKPYMELSITNTLPYYIVDQVFEGYTVGQKIDMDTYLALTEDNKKKCYSSIVTINFDPKVILVDMTNDSYNRATNIGTTTIDGKEYINTLTISIDAVSSEDIRFYKVDVSQDYTYPNGGNLPIVNVTSR